MGQQFHSLLDDYHHLNDAYRALQMEHSELERNYEKICNRIKSRRSLFDRNSVRLEELCDGLQEIQFQLKSDLSVDRDLTDRVHMLINDARKTISQLNLIWQP